MAVSSLDVTEEPGAALTQVDVCTLEINIQYEVIPTIVCSVCLSFGLIYCFFGYRCFKLVTFLSGVMFGSAAVLLLYHEEPELNNQLEAETKAGIGLGVGVLSGLMTMTVSTLGLLLGGLQLGSLLSLFVLVVVGHFYVLSPVWAPLCAVLAASIAAAVFTLQWQKPFSILYTSVFGAATATLGVDYLLGTFVLPDQVRDVLCQVAPRPLCWLNWAIAGICPALSVSGVLVQWWVTAKGVSHTETAQEKQKKHLKHKCRESRRRPQPYRQRRPPPLKRYAGDVLAPSYLQRLQEHQMGTGSSTGSVGTNTLMDFETSSTAPLTSPVFTV